MLGREQKIGFIEFLKNNWELFETIIEELTDKQLKNIIEENVPKKWLK